MDSLATRSEGHFKTSPFPPPASACLREAAPAKAGERVGVRVSSCLRGEEMKGCTLLQTNEGTPRFWPTGQIGGEENGMCPHYLRCLARKVLTWMIESAAAVGL